MAHGVMDDNLDTPATIAEVTVQEKPIVQPQGLTEDSSGDSFNQFIPSNGQGIPMTVASDFQYFALVLSRPKRAQEFALINLRPPSILNMNSSLTKAPRKQRSSSRYSRTTGMCSKSWRNTDLQPAAAVSSACSTVGGGHRVGGRT